MSEVGTNPRVPARQLGPYEAVDGVATRTGQSHRRRRAARPRRETPADGESADADGVFVSDVRRAATASTRCSRRRTTWLSEYRLARRRADPRHAARADAGSGRCAAGWSRSRFTFEAGAHYLFELARRRRRRCACHRPPRTVRETNGAIDASIDVPRSTPRCWPQPSARAPAIAPTRASANSAHR